MQNERLGYREAARKFELGNHGGAADMLQRWDRIYLTEGAAGLMEERRGRGSKASGIAKGRPPKLEKDIEEDLIAENQRLRMENEYLKKLHALALSKKKSRSETKPK